MHRDPCRNDEHFEVDNDPGATETIAAGWDFHSWRAQLMLGYRYVNTTQDAQAFFRHAGYSRPN